MSSGSRSRPGPRSRVRLAAPRPVDLRPWGGRPGEREREMARVAFVMEQTLGHVTHARNLASALAERPEIAADWLPIPFEVDGLARLLPYYRGNWSVRASWRARRALDAAEARGPISGLMFHTQ